MDNHKQFSSEAEQQKYDMQQLIGNTLRIGVTLACIIAFIGGIIYLTSHGSEAFNIETYRNFEYGHAEAHAEYTTLTGIWQGLTSGTAFGWIQTGVIILLLTPIMRVLLSLLDFIKQHDWLYAVITAVVLGVIISNSLGGLK